ncbi:MAG: replication-relaxation family protein [Acidobacteria bacterium]|nr:replication-relaxation family protein [Acidobacteriota bacterium]MBV9184209.1 replication-relaxation family protein [Acidobacteriota bacterium]
MSREHIAPDTGLSPNLATTRADRVLDLRAVTPRTDLAPGMNSQPENPLPNDGGERGSDDGYTYRREYSPRYTAPDTAEHPTKPPPPNLLLDAAPPPHPAEAPASGPEVARDAVAVMHLIRMRVLSYDQLSRLTYHSGNKTVARRRLRRLQERGWIHTWDKPTARGGAPRYAYPSRKALAWGHAVMLASTEGTSLGPLVRLMVPATPRQPWKFEPGVMPLFLAHTEETNEAIIAWLRRSGERVLWASSWDCPFPDHVEWRTMPQPDYVLVLDREGSAQLVFGEHDRGTEGREVVARKLRAYRTWMETPDILARTIGFRTFHVFVTVSGERAPRRLDQLTQLVHDEGADTFTTLMLSAPTAVPALPPSHAGPMDFAHCRLCQTRVPLAAEVCPSCGAPTHQLARDDLTAELPPPPIDYAAEVDAPKVEPATSETNLPERSETGSDPSEPQERRSHIP